jgi:hypothetical protein
MKIQISLGEAVDRLSILDIKRDRIADPEKFDYIKREYDYLSAELANNGFYQDNDYYKDLYEVNSLLWDIEDRLRELEKQGKFEGEFIDLARKVYITNDKRSKIKYAINIDYKSDFREEKSYTGY